MRVLLCFGDSLTRGYLNPWAPGFPYSQFLQQGLDEEQWEVVTEGHDGFTTQDLAELLPADPQRYSLVFLLAGTNDLGTSSSASEILERLCKLHEWFHQAGVPTVAMSIPASGVDTVSAAFLAKKTTINEELEKWASSNPQVHFFDLFSAIPFEGTTLFEGGPHFNDHLHFSKQGYQRMGELLFEFADHLGLLDKKTDSSEDKES